MQLENFGDMINGSHRQIIGTGLVLHGLLHKTLQLAPGGLDNHLRPGGGEAKWPRLTQEVRYIERRR